MGIWESYCNSLLSFPESLSSPSSLQILTQRWRERQGDEVWLCLVTHCWLPFPSSRKL